MSLPSLRKKKYELNNLLRTRNYRYFDIQVKCFLASELTLSNWKCRSAIDFGWFWVIDINENNLELLIAKAIIWSDMQFQTIGSLSTFFRMLAF